MTPQEETTLRNIEAWSSVAHLDPEKRLEQINYYARQLLGMPVLQGYYNYFSPGEGKKA